MPDPYAAPGPRRPRLPGAGGLRRLLSRFRTLGAPQSLLDEVADDWEAIDTDERRRWVNAPDGALLREIDAHRTDPEHVPDPEPPAQRDPEPQPPIIGAADDYAGVPTYTEAVAEATGQPRVGIDVPLGEWGELPAEGDAGAANDADPGTPEQPLAQAAADLADSDLVVPDGNVQEVLDWVGDDTTRAAAALAAEHAREAGPRSTVTTVLDRMLERASED